MSLKRSWNRPYWNLAAARASEEIFSMIDRTLDEEIIRRLTPQQKLSVMNGLIRQAYALKAAGIRILHPNLPDDEVQARARAAVAGDGT